MVAIWVCLCTFLNLAGWLLSATHSLNRTGYAVLFGLALIPCWIWRQALGRALCFNPRKLLPRFKRLFPASFLLLATLAILGGVLHPPANFDALAYRIPRVLHWLAADQWHWIHTEFPRLNTRICGIEWVSAPLILFLKSDRLLFLINAVSFLLLPGLIFSVLRQLGVRSRVAWHWMWLFPGGYGYLLQAGSIANDLFGAVFGLAAIDYALRARRTHKLSDVLLSVLSAAMLTAAKTSNLPLLLPWLLALCPSWRLIVQRPVAVAATAMVAAGVSFLPTAVLNVKYCGDWTGLNIETANLRGGHPFFHLAVNTVLLTIQNLAPPIFPLAAKWNALMTQLIPPGLAEMLQARFENKGARLWLGEMQMEEAAGLGCGLSILLLLTLCWRVWRRVPWLGGWLGVMRLEMLVVGGAWIAAAVFMAKSGLTPAARYLLPHYVLLAAPILMGVGVVPLVQRRWWRVAAMTGVALAVMLIIATPPRPLWPATTLLQAAGAEHSTNPLVRRGWTVYSVYGMRADAFAPARAILPPEADPLGLVTFDDPETSLWRPFGTRRLLHLRTEDAASDLRQRNIRYVLASSAFLARASWGTLDEWLKRVNGEIIQTLPLELRADRGPKDWYLVRIRPAGEPGIEQ